jgi:phospholipid/cholesterol/gamma-HCH transport system substrate-binding protein
MLRRTVKIQLVIFVIITLLGVSYVSAEYVGIFRGLGSNACTVSAEFPDSGGIFTNAEVTYRGVTVGRVGQLHLINNGVKVDLNLNDCNKPAIPVDSSAIVADRSVIGEQYVNLVPTSAKGPFMRGGEVITEAHTAIPTSAQQLLTDMDSFINSVDLPALRTTISELGQALSNRGQDLGNLLDASNELLTSAQDNLPNTISLINASATVLQTQLDEKPALQSFTHNLNLLSQQLKSSDPDIRNLLDQGPADLQVVSSFVKNNRTDLGAVIANLATTGETILRHIDGLTEILELYPALAAGGQTSLGTDGVVRLGFILQVQNDPPDCGDPKKGGEGYSGTDRRQPSDTAPKAPNVAAHCTAPPSSGTNVRGSANVPGGDPISVSGGGVAYPRATTQNTVRVGDDSGPAAILGDRSWITILTTALG